MRYLLFAVPNERRRRAAKLRENGLTLHEAQVQVEAPIPTGKAGYRVVGRCWTSSDEDATLAKNTG